MQTITFNEATLWKKTLRLGTSASLAVCVTGLLLMLMCSLIAMDPPEIVEDSIKIIDVVMEENREIIEQTEPPIEKPADPDPQPELPEIVENFNNVESVNIAMSPRLDFNKLDIGGGISSGSAMPIFKVAPQYPRSLQARGIEGFVDLMFDISPTGKTQNIRVIYSEPNGSFDRASIKALKKWKYKPAVNDGVAIVQKNQTTRISFNLED